MAKKISNFKKFGKLASLVKKIADQNPVLKEQILQESTSKSKNSWNKIQKWTSTNLFQQFKSKPLKEFTKKNVEQALQDIKKGVKASKCFSVLVCGCCIFYILGLFKLVVPSGVLNLGLWSVYATCVVRLRFCASFNLGSWRVGS